MRLLCGHGVAGGPQVAWGFLLRITGFRPGRFLDDGPVIWKFMVLEFTNGSCAHNPLISPLEYPDVVISTVIISTVITG